MATISLKISEILLTMYQLSAIRTDDSQTQYTIIHILNKMIKPLRSESRKIAKEHVATFIKSNKITQLTPTGRWKKK